MLSSRILNLVLKSVSYRCRHNSKDVLKKHQEKEIPWKSRFYYISNFIIVGDKNKDKLGNENIIALQMFLSALIQQKFDFQLLCLPWSHMVKCSSIKYCWIITACLTQKIVPDQLKKNLRKHFIRAFWNALCSPSLCPDSLFSLLFGHVTFKPTVTKLSVHQKNPPSSPQCSIELAVFIEQPVFITPCH